MKYNEAMEYLESKIGYKPRVADVAHILGLSSPKTLYQRAHRNSSFRDMEIKILLDYYCRNDHVETNKCTQGDKVEIKYYHNPKLKTDITTDCVTSIWFDRELVTNIWRRNPEDLKITTMLGNKMDSGAYPLCDGDILMMDMGEQDPTKAGIYAFTTLNDSYMFINGVARLFDGRYRFYFYNDSYPDRILTPQEVKEADVKIIGRIIKNLSLTI